MNEELRPNSGFSPPEVDAPDINGADPTYSNDMSRLEHKLFVTSTATAATVLTGRWVYGETAYILPSLYALASSVPAVLLVSEPRIQAGAAGVGMAALCRLIDRGSIADCAKYGVVMALALYGASQYALPFAKKVGYMPY